jgi:hypothetical protein
MGPSYLMGGTQRLNSLLFSIFKIRICQENLMVNRSSIAFLPPLQRTEIVGSPNDSTKDAECGAFMGRLSKIFS